MIRLVSLFALLLVPMMAWGQPIAPPLEVYDGTNACQPAYAIQFGAGSVSCGQTVDGRPLATINVGATPGTVPWSNVTAGSNANNLNMNGGILSPGTGTVEANRMQSGDITLTAISNTGMTASGMYVGDAAAGSLKIAAIVECDINTEKIQWTAATRTWSCVTDMGGQTSGQVRVTTNDTTASELNNKITVGNGIVKAVKNPGANETLDFAVPLRGVAGGGTTSSISGLEFIGGEITLLQGCGANQVVAKNATNTGYACASQAAADFGSLTGGENNQAPMVVGSGASLTASGTGTIAATTSIGASTTPTLCPAGQYSRGVDAGFNATGCTTPPGSGSGAPGGSINSIQYNLDNSAFAGSTRWNVDPANGELVGSCNPGTSGDCAWQLIAENGPVAAPTGTNESAVYTKRTGNTYNLCWNGEGDTGERCTGGIIPPPRQQEWDMAGLSNDGTVAESQWDYESGTTTPTIETAGIMRYASLAFAQAGTTCVQRKFRFGPQDDVNPGSLDARLYWKTSATGGGVEFSVQAACWNTGIAETAVAWIGTAINPGSDAVNGAGQRNFISFDNIEITGCSQFSTVILRLCQVANTLTGGDQLARAIQFVHTMEQQITASGASE